MSFLLKTSTASHSVVLCVPVALRGTGRSQSLLDPEIEPECRITRSTYPEIVGISSLGLSPQLGTMGVAKPCFIVEQLVQASIGRSSAACTEKFSSSCSFWLKKSLSTCLKTKASSQGLTLLVASTSRNLWREYTNRIN